MVAIILCIASFLGCFFAARLSLVYGLVAVLGVGYAYGILRANVYEIFSHFIFDAGLLGLYLAQVIPAETVRAGEAPGFTGPHSAFGLNLGWTPVQLRSGRSDHQPTTYAELQGRQHFWGLAIGVALSPGDWTRARSGVQVTPLCGPFYLRLQSMFDGRLSVELGLAIKIPVLIAFGG